jgi:hypothetical protein
MKQKSSPICHLTVVASFIATGPEYKFIHSNLYKNKKMEKETQLISITNHVDEFKKNCLLVELTIDGATKLANMAEQPEAFIDMSELYDNEPDNNDLLKMRFSSLGDQIYTRAIVPWDETPVQVANMWKTNEEKLDIVARWLTDPKEKFYFYPQEKDNAERQKDITAKMSATTWAIYSQQSVNAAALETTARHNVVAIAFGKVDEVKRVFNYDNYKQDDKYYEKLAELSTEMEKELDFCAQKMRLLHALTGNDYNSAEVVSRLYRDLRKVSHDKVNMNVKHTIDNKEEAPAMTSFFFDYEPLGWKDMHTVQKSKDDAVKAMKQAANKIIIGEQLPPFDENKLILIKEEPHNEVTAESAPDSKGNDGGSVGEVATD